MIGVEGMAPMLAVFDMPTSIKFYCEILGCEILRDDEKPAPDYDWVLLSLDGAEFMLNTAYETPERPPQPDPARIAAHEDTSLYFKCPDVDSVYRRLQELGVKVKPPRVARYGMKQLYVTDPDGYLLCFQWHAEPESKGA